MASVLDSRLSSPGLTPNRVIGQDIFFVSASNLMLGGKPEMD